MRVVYLLIAVFLLLCVFFARWYLCEVHGLCTFPASTEILLMLLAAFFIGFAASWLLRESAFGDLRREAAVLSSRKAGAEKQLSVLEKENESTRKRLAEWQQEAFSLGQQRKKAEDQNIATQEELQLYQRRYEGLKTENDSIRERAEQLKAKLAEAERPTETGSEKVVERESTVEEALEAHELFRSRFTPSTWQTQKDDLSLISGIGPVIHRKLNELGIYSFQQISELTPAMVRRISTAIKFFPDRIGRDNWIGQAAALALMRRK